MNTINIDFFRIEELNDSDLFKKFDETLAHVAALQAGWKLMEELGMQMTVDYAQKIVKKADQLKTIESELRRRGVWK